MTTHFHAVIWIDHKQARVFHIGLSGSESIVLQSGTDSPHIHHKANTIGSGHVHEGPDFLGRVADTVTDAGEILIMGPSTAKTELATYLKEKRKAAAARVIAVEPADHLTDAEITAFARDWFKLPTPRAVSSAGAPVRSTGPIARRTSGDRT